MKSQLAIGMPVKYVDSHGKEFWALVKKVWVDTARAGSPWIDLMYLIDCQTEFDSHEGLPIFEQSISHYRPGMRGRFWYSGLTRPK